MDQNIDTPNSLWGTMKESILHIITTEKSSIAGKLNLLFGVLSILFLIGCMSTSLVDNILKLWKPEIDLGFPPIYIVLMFLGVLIYFGYCVKFVDADKNDKGKIKKKES